MSSLEGSVVINRDVGQLLRLYLVLVLDLLHVEVVLRVMSISVTVHQRICHTNQLSLDFEK